jgi:RNA polymerase sigma factor (sigma-70 family)
LSDKSTPSDGTSEARGQPSLLTAYAAKRADLIRFFTARMGSASDAEDLIQDLYLKLSAMTSVEAVENPSAFLYRTAVNLMLDRARGARRSTVRDDAWRQTQGSTFGDTDIADEPSPEQATASRQRLRQLVDAVQTLPPQTRRAFELHKLEGLSHAETAERLGVSRKTVEKQISAALRALLAKLGRTD